MKIANPIYDTVFKKLIEQRSIAERFLSVMLETEVELLHMEPQEVTSAPVGAAVVSSKRPLQIFRVDYSAMIKGPDGKKHKVLIELQKALVPEVLGRFRAYLGGHYLIEGSKREETLEDRKTGVGHVPLIGLYLLGFTLDETLPKAFRVAREYLRVGDASRTPLCARPDFCEKLTHDAVFVQLPKVHEPGDQEVDEMLRIFDQNLKTEEDPHVLTWDEDSDGTTTGNLTDQMARVLAGLIADPAVRQQMALEDEVANIANNLEALETQRDAARQERDEARMQADEARMQAEEARMQAEEENQRAEAEKRRAEEALAELARFKELLKQSGLEG